MLRSIARLGCCKCHFVVLAYHKSRFKKPSVVSILISFFYSASVFWSLETSLKTVSFHHDESLTFVPNYSLSHLDWKFLVKPRGRWDQTNRCLVSLKRWLCVQFKAECDQRATWRCFVPKSYARDEWLVKTKNHTNSYCSSVVNTISNPLQ